MGERMGIQGFDKRWKKEDAENDRPKKWPMISYREQKGEQKGKRSYL